MEKFAKYAYYCVYFSGISGDYGIWGFQLGAKIFLTKSCKSLLNKNPLNLKGEYIRTGLGQ